MVGKDEILSKAVKFDMGADVFVEARSRIRSPRWTVCRMDSVLNMYGEWEYEPMPSNRYDGFLARTRFEFNDAWSHAESAVRSIMGKNDDRQEN